MSPTGGSLHRRDLCILIATVGLFALPILVDLLLSDDTAPFRYSSPDSFYYHTVARNFAQSGVPSYDGIHPTNGFHPLWQGALAGLYWVCGRTGVPELFYLHASLHMGVLTITIAIVFIALALVRSGRRLPLSFLLLPFGAYALILAPYWILAVDGRGLAHWSQGPFPLFGTLWSYVNGMESGFVLMAWGALALTFVTSTPGSTSRAAKLGFLAAALCLARLDHGAFGLPVLAHFAVGTIRQHERTAIKKLVAFVLCFGVPILIYVIANQIYAGTALPVSGTAKSTFPIPSTANFRNLGYIAREPLTSGRSISAVYRATQLLLPALAAVLFLLVSRPGRRSTTSRNRWTEFLRLTAYGVLLLATYNFLFVKAFAMGHWYVPVSTLFMTLCVLGPPAAKAASSSPASWPGPLLAAVCILTFVFLHRRADYHWLYAQMYLVEGPEARAHYAGNPPELLEFDDGIVAFSTGFPCMSGLGLALDRESARAHRNGQLIPFALERGFEHASSLVYRLPADAGERGRGLPGEPGARAHVAAFARSTPGYSYEAEYISSSGYFWIVRNLSREGQPPARR